MLNIIQGQPLLGEPEIARMVTEFYKQVKQDDLIGPLYPDSDWQGAEQRLRDFLIFRLGGSDRYIQERGHPRLRMRHATFKIGEAESQRWVQLMRTAMQRAEIPESIVQQLEEFFAQVATFLRNSDS